jgi:MOSC domain-containing protein YiiM
MAKVTGLFIAPGSRAPMQACSVVTAVAGQGLAGDRYAAGRGTYSQSPRPVARHVSLIAREAMAAANADLTRQGLAPFDPAETRRNIVVDGFDVYQLLGRAFRIGGVRLRGTDITRPCPVPDLAAGKAGFKQAYHDRGGILAEILSDGHIAVGDELTVDTM